MENSNKNILRQKHKIIRNGIVDKDIKSDTIFEKVINHKFYKDANVIALYKNLSVEVDTSKIIDYSLRLGKIVALPRVIDSNKLIFYKINSTKDLKKNNFGIWEPEENDSNLILKENIDLFIIPGICFDKNRNRLGFGRGYYDCYLQNSKAKKMGICFDEQISEEIIDAQEYDIKMDFIITDKKEI